MTVPSRQSDLKELSAAKSNAFGTVLPRTGVFWGITAPKGCTTVVIGDYPDDTYSAQSIEPTIIRGWHEPHPCFAEQTSLVNALFGRRKLADFEVDPGLSYTDVYFRPTWNSRPYGIYQTNALPVYIRNFGAACAFLSSPVHLTQSLSLRLRELFAQLRIAIPVSKPTALHLESEVAGALRRHAGLTAIAWLTEMLGLTRPTILRMAGVPESTFYSWRKSPESVVRTHSVTRLLKLQASIGLLAEVLGEDKMKNWILTPGRLESLQGEDEHFTHTLSQVEDAIARAVQIQPRERMSLEGYLGRREISTDGHKANLPRLPAASMLHEEQED